MMPYVPTQRITFSATQLPMAIDYPAALALRQMVLVQDKLPKYLLAPEVSSLLHYVPDLHRKMLLDILWNTGIRPREAQTLIPGLFDLDVFRPFVRVLSEKMRARCGHPLKDEVRLIPLTDGNVVRQMKILMMTMWPRRRDPLWRVTDKTMLNWLKQMVKRAGEECVHFSIPVTPHMFRHSYIMHMLYHRHYSGSGRTQRMH